MKETTWVNGQYVERTDAHLSVFDASVQHGIGLFETMTASHAGVYRLDDHLRRLDTSARQLGLTDTLRIPALYDLVNRVVEAGELQAGERARVRLTITGGDLNLLRPSGPGPVDPTIAVHVQPATPYPDALFEQGGRAVISDTRVNPLDPTQGHKTINYWWRLRELQIAASKQAAEAIVFSITNHICSGAVSNLFIVKDGALHTPIARGEEVDGSMPSAVLPGITRGAVLEFAESRGIAASTRMLSIDDLLAADEVFLTNSSWGVLPVVGVEAETIGEGQPGPLTLDLRAAWQTAIDHTD